MPLTFKSGFKRNVQLMSTGGFAGTSSSSYSGPYDLVSTTTAVGHVLIDIVWRSWQADSEWKSFRRLNGYLPTRPMDIRRIVAVQRPVTMQILESHATDGKKYSRIENACWNLGPNVDVFPPNFNNPGTGATVVDAAKSKCLSRARDMKISLPIALAEGRKTVQLLAETAKKLYEAYKAFKAGNFRKVAELLGIGKQGSANNWLSYQYGWLPLLADAKGLAELAAQQLSVEGRKPRFRVSASDRDRGQKHIAIGPSDGWTTVGVGGLHQSTLVFSAPERIGTAWLFLEVEYSDSALAAQLGFGGFTDIASVAWELIPFSFVFDWFVDVGERLEIMSALSGLKVLDGGCGYSQETQVKKWASIPAYYNSFYNYTWDKPGPVVVGNWQRYQRSNWTGDLPPSITIKGFDALGARRLTSLGALGLQLFGGKP